MNKLWTEQDRRILEVMRIEGKTCQEIGLKLDRSPTSVRQKASLLQIPRFQSRLMEWLEALSVPHSRSEVMERLGVRRGTFDRMKNKLKRIGYRLPRAKYKRRTGP